ncbi:MAG: hypothetical protein K0R46_2644 [Herbinix sp.]|nr:hypothetical protein [Herbinix sp.]
MAKGTLVFGDNRILLFFFSMKAPKVAKIRWVNARRTTTSGKAAMKKPMLEIRATVIATKGEINIAINIATWLASVKDAGSMMILGANIGIAIPSALKSAATVMIFTLFEELFVIVASILLHCNSSFLEFTFNQVI